ncbi:MAG: hypothetical protein ACJAYC_000764 [Halieaceae bacterium]|jgi:hypothetical protein
MSKKIALGWREWIGFPDLGIPFIKAKVDTGARTSCLHAFWVEPFKVDGAPWVRFSMHPVQGSNSTEVIRCEAPLLDKRLVRDSGGHEELRHVINTTIKVGEVQIKADVTLTDRDSMKFRVLLGRTAIRGNFVVDPARSYLYSKSGKRKQTKVRHG